MTALVAAAQPAAQVAQPGPVYHALATEAPSALHAALWRDALTLHHNGPWAGAYGRFMVLADAGNAQAARIALHMLREARNLYGTEYSATPDQLRAARDG